MTQITDFRTADFDALREDINKALEAVGAKHGISLAIGSISYRAELATTKLSMSLGEGKDRDDLADDKLRSDFKRYAHRVSGLSLEKTYFLRDGQYQIIGYSPKAKQYPIVAKNVKTGKRFKFPTSTFLLAQSK